MAPGSGGLGAQSGQAFGSGIFLQGYGTLTFAPGAGQTQRISDAIADQYGSGGTIVEGTDGAWSLVKTGAGTLALTGANTYTGGTTIAAGALLFGRPAAIAGSGANVLVKAGAVAAAGYPIDQNFLARIAPSSQGVVALAADSANRLDLNAAGLGGVSLGALGAATLSGPLTPAGDTFRLGGASGALTVAAPLAGPASLVVNGSGVPGTVVLSGGNSYTGGTTVAAGTLRMGAAGVVPAAGAVVLDAGSVLDLAGFNQALGDLSGGGSVTLGNATLAAGGDNRSTGFAGVISGMGGLVKTGTGTLTLSGANSYLGGTTVASGVLRTGVVAAMPAAGAVAVNRGAVFDLASFNQTVGGLSGGGLVRLGSAILTVGGDNRSTGFAGVISGMGGLVKSGIGILTLTGRNTYSGGTDIAAGTLQGDSTSLQGNIIDNARLVFDQPRNGTFAGSLSGNGVLVKANGGRLVLDGDSGGFAGATLVEGGGLEIGDASDLGARLGGDVTVESGAILAGHGAIGGSLTNLGGAVMPGGTIGTLTVGGNYTQSPAGTLVVEVSPAAASQLVVGGHASLAGTLALAYDPGTYAQRTYTPLRAGSVSGSFAAVTGRVPTAGLHQAVRIDPTDVQLALTGAAPIPPPGPPPPPPPGPPAPIVVAPSNDTIFGATTSALVFNGQQANAILLDRLDERLGGLDDAPPAGELASGGGSTQLAAAGNLAALAQFASLLPQAAGRYGGWFRGVGSFGSLEGNASAPGFSADAGGFLAGLDRPLAPGFLGGFAAGYTHSAVNEQAASSAAVDTARFAFYGGGEWGPAVVSTAVSYAHDWIDTGRGFYGIGTAAESHGGNEAAAGAQTARFFQFDAAALAAKAGVQYLHLGESEFSENGANGLDLASGNRSTDSFQPYLRLAATRTFVTAENSVVAPTLRLGYAREVLSNSRAVNVSAIDGTAFLVEGVKPSRDMLTAGVGVTVRMRTDLFLFARYDALLPVGNTIDHAVSAGLRLRF